MYLPFQVLSLMIVGILFSFPAPSQTSSLNKNANKKRNPTAVSLSSQAYLASRDPQFESIHKKVIDELESATRRADKDALRTKKIYEDYLESLVRHRSTWNQQNTGEDKCEYQTLQFKKAVSVSRQPKRFKQLLSLSHSCDISVPAGNRQNGFHGIVQSIELSLAIEHHEDCQSFISCTQQPLSVSIESFIQSSKVPGVPIPAGGMSSSGGD